MSVLESLKRLLTGGPEPANGHVVLRVDFDFTLMRLDPALEVHVSSGNRPKTWFFEVDQAWADGREPVWDALREIFRRENERMRAAEPADPNYLAPVEHRQTPVAFEPRGPYPWEQAGSIVWETSSCFAVESIERIVPLAPTAFTNHLLLRLLSHGGIEPAEFREIALPRFEGNGGLVDRIVADPGAFLKIGLDIAESGAGWG